MSKYAQNRQGSSGVSPKDSFSLRKFGSKIERFIPVQILFNAISSYFTSNPVVRNFVNVTSDYSVLVGQIASCDATSGDIDVTLPSAIAGQGLVVTRTDSSSNSVTIIGTVNDVVNPTLFQYDSYQLEHNGTNWILV